MFSKLLIRRAALAAGALAFASALAGGALIPDTIVRADSSSIDFESYALGSINGQDGWSSTGSAGGGCAVYDHAVDASGGVAGFGAQSFRISNAVTSGCFGDQTFSKSLADEAGETSAQGGGMSGGTRRAYFEAGFELATVVPVLQPGLAISVSPDRGDGARMSYLRFEDQADGVHVFFDDYRDVAPLGTVVGDPNGCDGPDDFFEADVATLDRSSAHSIKFEIDFVDGAGNDVVRILIDGSLVQTGTTWEDYFRYCEGNPTRTVDSLLFRSGGAAAPATAGDGFLIDNLSLFSGDAAPSSTTVVVIDDTSAGENLPGWMFNRDTTTDTPFAFDADEASIGSGSIHVLPIGATPADKFIGEFFMLSPLADVEDISYDFQIGASGTAADANQFYMNVYANFAASPANKFYDCRYSIVPVIGSTSAFTTVTFDPDLAYPVTQSGTSPAACPASPAAMGPGATLRAVALNVGDSSASDVGLDGYLDNVVVALSGGTTVYDFEPSVGPPTSKDQCKKNGWMTFNNPSFKNQGSCVSYFNHQ